MKIHLPATLLALLLLAPPAARACEVMHELSFDFEDGRHEVYMNGVYIMGGDKGGTGGRPLWPFQFMVPGENEVTVKLLDDKAAAKLAILKG